MSRSERAAAAVYRYLLALLPSPFRRAYAREMLRMFDDRQRKARSVPSRLPGAALCRVWRREFPALLATAVLARVGDGRDGAPASIPPGPRSPARKGPHMDSFILDLKTAVRSLRAHRGQTAAAALALALGIGANTVMFSVVYGVLQHLPYPGWERLALVYEDRAGDRGSYLQLSAAEYTALESDDSVFEELAAYQYSSALLEGDPYPESVGGVRLTHDFMDMLGARPLLGREFTESDSEDDAVVVVGYELWQRRWGGDPGLVGVSSKDVVHRSH